MAPGTRCCCGHGGLHRLTWGWRQPPISEAGATRQFRALHPGLEGSYECHARENDGSVDLPDVDFACRQTDASVIANPDVGHAVYWVDVREGVIAADASSAP